MLKKKTLRSVTLFHVKNQIDSNKTIFFSEFHCYPFFILFIILMVKMSLT